MKIPLAYGRGHLDVEFPDDCTTLIEPSPQNGVPDERAALIAALDDETVRAAHLIPCRDIAATVRAKLVANPNARIAVLPQGPLTIPYLAGKQAGQV